MELEGVLDEDRPSVDEIRLCECISVHVLPTGLQEQSPWSIQVPFLGLGAEGMDLK
jgi:hypothetical protein